MQEIENKPAPITINIKTINSDRHVSFVANRIWGGLQPNGLFELNFLLEHSILPETLTMQIENGTENETSRSNKNEFIRENQATAYLSMETLLGLQSWLNFKIQELQGLKLFEEQK